MTSHISGRNAAANAQIAKGRRGESVATQPAKVIATSARAYQRGNLSTPRRHSVHAPNHEIVSISTPNPTITRKPQNKGATSGNIQTLRELRYDCDADCLLAIVDSPGPACHTGERSCFFRTL